MCNRRVVPASALQPRPNGDWSARREGSQTSVTVRPIGPAVSWLCAMGMMPSCDTSPHRGLQTDDQIVPRRAHDRPVGLGADRRPRTDSRPAATASPSSIRRDRSRGRKGLRVKPPRALQPSIAAEAVPTFAHSERLALPRITAPATAQPGDDGGVARHPDPRRGRASLRWSPCCRR